MLTRGLLFKNKIIPNVFSSSSPKVHQVLIVFPNMFPIVPYFCPICFAQSCLLLTYHIRWDKEGAFHLLVETSILWSLRSNFLQTFKDEMITLKSHHSTENSNLDALFLFIYLSMLDNSQKSLPQIKDIYIFSQILKQNLTTNFL